MVTIAMNEGNPLYIELPTSIVTEVETEPGLQGDRSSGGTKAATIIATGYQIQVPLYLETGTMVKIDTRDGSFLGRVNS